MRRESFKTSANDTRAGIDAFSVFSFAKSGEPVSLLLVDKGFCPCLFLASRNRVLSFESSWKCESKTLYIRDCHARHCAHISSEGGEDCAVRR